MKRFVLLWLMLAAFILCAGSSPVGAQTSRPRILFRALPLHDGEVVSSAPVAAAATAASGTLPMWSYTTTASRDGHTYHGSMIGRSPFFHGARTTNINTILVPVKITITDSNNVMQVFDPTQPDACLPNGTATAASLTQQSPILMPASFTMNDVDEGTTQYIDAFQRASFFSAINPTGDSYHTLLNLTKTVPISVTMNSPQGAIADGLCGKLGVVDLRAFDSMVSSTLLPALAAQGVSPTTLPMFLFYNVVMTEGPPDPVDPFKGCCVLGYHSGKGLQANAQLYAVSDYDSSGLFFSGSPIDAAILSHEIGELFDDPLVNNDTPAWGNIGQVAGCQSNLEVGDPLSGTFVSPVTMPNDVTYHLQELAFFSWFFGPPSLGAGDVFSNNGAFTDAALPCP